ncbi:DMT family transporter [Aurantibacter aestuarii]|uniref:EamA family transporter n=1 Tax=Aurantibacter aestuarii TaxID=1266046 RepID=A0A2T1ND87_9FLAO|nr:DMT family transporter [Aurantibacter aestuarii]PSG90394.1 EamA family transporter [Aurantibacter aestuarii]
MNTRALALIAVFMVQLLYGLTFTFAKGIINEGLIAPFGFILVRIIGATALFWILSIFTKNEKIERKDFLTFFLASIFGIALNMLTFFKGLEYTTPINASVIMITVPIIVLLLSAIFLAEKLTLIKVLGVFLGFSGAIILSLYGSGTSSVGSNVPLGNLLVFINAASYSVYIIIIKKVTSKYHPFSFIKWLFLFGLCIVLPFGYEDLTQVELYRFTAYDFFAVAFVVVGATFGTYLLNPIGLRHLKASTVTTFIYLQPVIAAIFAIAMGADSLNVIKVLAAAIIFSGVYLVTKKKKEKQESIL